MPTYKVTGYDRTSGDPAEVVVDASSESEAAKQSGIVASGVKICKAPKKTQHAVASPPQRELNQYVWVESSLKLVGAIAFIVGGVSAIIGIFAAAMTAGKPSFVFSLGAIMFGINMIILSLFLIAIPVALKSLRVIAINSYPQSG